jgi:hypothetical protein
VRIATPVVDGLVALNGEAETASPSFLRGERLQIGWQCCRLTLSMRVPPSASLPVSVASPQLMTTRAYPQPPSMQRVMPLQNWHVPPS